MDTATKRLFLGTFLDQDAQARFSGNVHDALAKFWKIKVRKVRPEKLHLTWCFAGNITARQEQELNLRLAPVMDSLAGCELNYTRLELFPHKHHPRLIALTPEHVPNQCIVICKKIREAAEGLCEQEGREQFFRPHITVFRLPANVPRNLVFPAEFPPPELLPVRHRVDRVCLIRSYYDQGQDGYDLLQTYALK